MRLDPGEHLLRLSLLTPAHLGSAEGEAAVDRPTHRDASTGLPCIPDSALKGVLAGLYGDSDAELENPRREEIFGSPDRSGRRGAPGRLVLGDGELLAFPLPARDGTRTWIFPARSIGRLLGLAPPPAQAGPILALLGAVEEDPGTRALAFPRLPDIAAVPNLRPLTGGAVRRAGAALSGLLAHWAGPAIPRSAPWLVVARPLARRLWAAAAERRVLTSLGDGKTVRPGSLRAVELIPAGTVFLSWATAFGALELDCELLQLGAWEGLGLGWAAVSRVAAVTAAAPLADGEGAADAGSLPAGAVPDEAEVLADMFRAVEALRDGAPELLPPAHAAIGDFAARVLRSGIEAALAFELAKAKPAAERPSDAARSHRWLLEALLSGAPQVLPRTGASRTLLDWLGDPPFPPERTGGLRELILSRWLWLRRHAELGLRPDAPGAPPRADRRA